MQRLTLIAAIICTLATGCKSESKVKSSTSDETASAADEELAANKGCETLKADGLERIPEEPSTAAPGEPILSPTTDPTLTAQAPSENSAEFALADGKQLTPSDKSRAAPGESRISISIGAGRLIQKNVPKSLLKNRDRREIGVRRTDHVIIGQGKKTPNASSNVCN